MILRKPYAFLIKYFRLIHIIMFVFFIYLVFALREIYIFFKDYIGGNGYMYFENMASKYVSPWLLGIVILLFVLAISIFYLMRKKEKPVLFYRLVMGYTVILLGVLIYYYFFFKSLSTTNYEALRMVINRDIIMIIYYINYLFVGFSFIRAFGFDIKKFSFEKDRRELQLDESDNEEYEFNILPEKDEIASNINRHKREFSYYLKENSQFFTIVGSIAIVSLVLYFLYNHFIVNKVYREKQDVSIGKVTYNVKKSTITSVDKYGRNISDESDFLVVYLNIKNNGDKLKFDEQQFRVNTKDKYYYPAISYCDYFNDLGECYHDTEFGGNLQKDYIIVYKLEKKHPSVNFEILKSKSGGFRYNKIRLSFTNDYKEIVEHKLNETFNINDVNYQVMNYELSDKANYEYEECVDNKCNKYVKLVKPKLGDKLLTLEIENLESLKDDFLSNYVGLKYRNKVLYGSDIGIIDRYKNMLYLNVPSIIHNEDKLVLTINARNKEYDILLKEGVNE